MSEFRDPFKPSAPIIVDDTNDDSSLESDNCDDSDVPPVAFPGHRDTLALLHLRNHPEPAITAATTIPSEIVQQIYQHLDPLDFHAARHTCKKWFLASLDTGLLRRMTRKAGCSQAADEDAQRLDVRTERRRLNLERRLSLEHAGQQTLDCHAFKMESSISDEWLLSKRLATEARITPGKHTQEPVMTRRDEIDFGGILPHPPTGMESISAVQNFTVSSCCKFILVNCGQIIHIYAFCSPIRLIKTLSCPRQVVAVSMDTSSNRYSVAALLEGRLGMCWDLDICAVQAASPPMIVPIRRLEQDEIPTDSGQHEQARSHIAPHLVGQERDPVPEYVTFESTNAPMGASSEVAHAAATYEQLGSPDDPPRSVAICPQRKCVAFGCRMGIELHWVDASTGGDLKRWFPLAAPSDFLHFLPQRPSIDSAKKLRLISSAGGPGSRISQSRP
jgi:hypothetical protein